MYAAILATRGGGARSFDTTDIRRPPKCATGSTNASSAQPSDELSRTHGSRRCRKCCRAGYHQRAPEAFVTPVAHLGGVEIIRRAKDRAPPHVVAGWPRTVLLLPLPGLQRRSISRVDADLPGKRPLASSRFAEFVTALIVRGRLERESSVFVEEDE